MENLKKLQRLFQTLSDENRLKIIRFIGKEEQSVSTITEQAGLSQPLVSHHLKTMKQSGILQTRRDGPFVLYSLSDKRLLELLGSLSELLNGMEITESETETFFPPPMWWRRMCNGKE